jgi:DNA-binding transcriptional regulator YhcF (GntR family)
MKIKSDLAPYGIVQRVVMGMVSSTAFTVYAALTTYSDNAGECFPAQKTLAKDLRISESTIRRAIGELEAKGVITVLRRKKKDGSNYPNSYMVNTFKAEIKPEPKEEVIVKACKTKRDVIEKTVLADKSVWVHYAAIDQVPQVSPSSIAKDEEEPNYHVYDDVA